MQMTDIRNSSERKKLISAGILGILALALLWWTFIGFGTTAKKPTPTTSRDLKPSSPGVRPSSSSNTVQPQNVVELKGDLLDQLRPVKWESSLPYVQEPKRNIFVYYEPPPPVVKPSIIPTPTPTPTPPVLLASLSPANVYARTSEFKLEISGDKFTP